MKEKLISLAIAALITTAAFGQKRKANYGNYPPNGTWVIESNVKTPKTQTVKFYNAWQQLIYQETIAGKELKFSKPKVQKKLNEALTKALAKDFPAGKTDLVAASLKR
jgi:hypothetical protein